MSAARHLKVVELDDNGEVVEPACPECQHREIEIAGLQKEIRSLSFRLRRAEMDHEADVYADPLYPVIEKHFALWRELTNHPRSVFTVDRFDVARPFAKSKKYGPLIPAGIRGIAFDHMTRQSRNGRAERFDGWETLFKSAGSFERYVNRAPIEGEAS